MERRAFLLGTAALVVGGAGVALGLNQDTRDAVTGAITSPDVQRGSFASPAMNTNVGWRLYIPANPMATVFVLHGRGGSAASAFDALHLDRAVETAGLQLAIASVDGGDASYWHKRKDGTDAMTMLMNEFMPMMESRTKTTTRALLGWSMGGYGALLAAATHPGTFAATAALSPALWTSSGQTPAGAFDSASDFNRNDVFAMRDRLASQSVHCACGQSDPFFSATKTFLTKLPQASSDLGPGGHDDGYWRSVAPRALAFIGDQLR